VYNIAPVVDDLIDRVIADEFHNPSLYFACGEDWPANELFLFSASGPRQHDLDELGLEVKDAKRELDAGAPAVSLCKGTGA